VNRTQQALERMAREAPELAARLIIQGLPAAAARIPGELRYDLTVDDVGSYRIAVVNGRAEVTRRSDGSWDDAQDNGDVDFRLRADARTLARMAAGESPARLMLSGQLRISGKRRRALRLRAMGDGEVNIADAVKQGAWIDVDAIHRALEYLIDPEWTEGHSFTVGYIVEGEGEWYVQVRDGEPVRVTREPPGDVESRVFLGRDTYRRLLAGELTPTQVMQRQLSKVVGPIYPMTLLGRWMERSQGRDEAELEREREQRALQGRRAGAWGGSSNGTALPVTRPVPGGQGDPGADEAGDVRATGDLLSYEQLYALWERQNWKAHEIDFSVDREHWVTTPRESQLNTLWSLGSFYVGEERVTADLAPFLLAAPSGELEVFLATQLVDEARHAAFFDRFAAEVMVLDADDFRGRMREVEEAMLGGPWHDVFDDGLRSIAQRLQAEPDNFDLFVEGIATYHIVIEGVLAMTGQRFILKYLEDHDLYPGFRKGFSLVEQDEHRHIAFGVRFLKDMIDRDHRYGEIVERKVEELVPRAMLVFFPPYAEDPRSFVSYGYRSEHIYGYAYRKLKRRMQVLGLKVPSAEELMPGPMAEPEEARAAGAPV
jgi:ribonucleoside-diphosphate reductase beta chain